MSAKIETFDKTALNEQFKEHQKNYIFPCKEEKINISLDIVQKEYKFLHFVKLVGARNTEKMANF